MEVDRIPLRDVQKRQKNDIWEPQQWHVFPETVSQLPKIIRRPLREPSSFKLLSTETSSDNERRATTINCEERETANKGA